MKINLTAPICSTGYGNCSRNILLALSRLGHEVALWPIGQIQGVDEADAPTVQAALERVARYDPTANSLRIWHQFDLAQHVGFGDHVAFPFFELDNFKPIEAHHLGNQDLLIVASQWAKDILDGFFEGVPPVYVAPLGVDRSIFHEGVKPSIPRGSDATVFCNIGKWEVRKGHDVLLDAFEKAFTREDNVLLMMASYNPCVQPSYSEQWASHYKKSKMWPKIAVHTERLPDQRAVASLMASVDCGVFPARAEAWNCEALEMLSMGKHVIATGYAGHTEFLDQDNARLIDIDTLEDAHDGVWFRADDPAWGGRPGRWAAFGSDQVDQLVDHLRNVHCLKQQGCLGVNAAGIETAKRFSWENCATKIVGALR